MGVLAQACFTLPTNLILRRQNNTAMAAPVSGVVEGVGFGSVGGGQCVFLFESQSLAEFVFCLHEVQV